jgi:hypothetical protein
MIRVPAGILRVLSWIGIFCGTMGAILCVKGNNWGTLAINLGTIITNTLILAFWAREEKKWKKEEEKER